jgi:hypothetical protein
MIKKIIANEKYRLLIFVTTFLVLGAGCYLHFYKPLDLELVDIVIDPGHGGDDPGTKTTIYGLDIQESDLVLEYSQNIKGLLKESGYKAELTRGQLYGETADISRMFWGQSEFSYLDI